MRINNQDIEFATKFFYGALPISVSAGMIVFSRFLELSENLQSVTTDIVALQLGQLALKVYAFHQNPEGLPAPASDWSILARATLVTGLSAAFQYAYGDSTSQILDGVAFTAVTQLGFLSVLDKAYRVYTEVRQERRH